MTLGAAHSGIPIFWVGIGALLAIRLAVGLGRRNRGHIDGAPVPAPTPAVIATEPVPPLTVGDRTTLLHVRDLTVAYGSKVAVDRVSFEIGRSEIFGLLGPNGAGKTTTLSAIEGLRRPRSGAVFLDGVDIVRRPALGKAQMGVQLQSTGFQSELTVRQVARLYAGLYGVALGDQELDQALADIGLGRELDRTTKQISGGQQQRLSLFVAVIHHPTVLLLDEPTTGLDPQSRRHLWARIEQVRADGGSILLTTHSMEEAQAVCDRVAIIDHGRVLAVDTPRNLIDQHRDDPLVRAAARGEPTLEDVFIGLTGSEIRD
ncbi:MAG: ABC transporter ATP-binding protein [Acidimicrobiales bacterium]|jgi:ABC-2 type transport system ATP-binding protein